MEFINGFIQYLTLAVIAAAFAALFWLFFHGVKIDATYFHLRNFIAKRRAAYHSRKADEFTAYSIQLQLLSTKYAMEAMRAAIKSAAIERDISERRYQRSRAAS